MFMERLGIFGRRAVAWWIDAFLAAAIIIVVRWTINAIAATPPLVGQSGAIYDIAALALVFYIYRVIVEARWSTSLGKWSLGLIVVAEHPGWWGAAIRNSWLLLTLLALTGWPNIEAILLAIMGISVLAIGQTPFDVLAGRLVERRPTAD